MKYNCGIYKIENLVTGDFYIGQSINLKLRKYQHFYELSNKKHCNKYFQNSFNKYKEENFLFSVLIFCDKNNLTLYEQLFVDKLNPNFNLCLQCTATPKGKQKTQGLIRIKNVYKKSNIPLKVTWYKTDYRFEEDLYSNKICLHSDFIFDNIINGKILKILKNNSYIWNHKNSNNTNLKAGYFFQILIFYFYLFEMEKKHFTKEMEKVIKRDYTSKGLKNILKNNFRRCFGEEYPRSEVEKIEKMLRNIKINIDKYRVSIYINKKNFNHLYILYI